MRRLALVLFSLLLITLLIVPDLAGAAAASLSGTLDRGTNTNGEGYLLFSLGSLADVTGVTVTIATGTDYIAVFAADQGATTKPSASVKPGTSVKPRLSAADTPLPYEDTPPWRVIGSRQYSDNGAAQPSPTFDVSPARRTRYLLVLARHFDGSGAPAPATLALNGTVVGGAPTNTPPPTGGTGTPAADCHDLGDGAVDQHGVSVDRWAPGLRKACGFLGYENGDNPMPPGTPFDAPRPFRFDSAYDHNEAVFGFKVFYFPGDTDHCGDMRAIIHQGGGTKGFTERFHTFQFAIALCDGARNKQIIDVGGQADTGELGLLSRPIPDGTGRFTADTVSCGGRPTPREGCFTRWYPKIELEVPGGGPDGSTGTGGASVEFQVDRPLTLADPNDLSRVVLANDQGAAGWDGASRTVSEWIVFNLKSGSQSTWWTAWDATRQKQVIVPAGTPGAWQVRVDAGIAPRGDGVNIANCLVGFGCQRQQHANPAAGIVYPN